MFSPKTTSAQKPRREYGNLYGFFKNQKEKKMGTDLRFVPITLFLCRYGTVILSLFSTFALGSYVHLSFTMSSTTKVNVVPFGGFLPFLF